MGHLPALCVLVLFLGLTALPFATLAGEATPALFSPPGMWTMDNWFAREGDTYHAFYLQVPRCISRPNDWSQRAQYMQIGHATSADLVHWTDHGPVLVPEPGTWRANLATGSVVHALNRWWMVFTATEGVGLAVSDDLMTWTFAEDHPIVRRSEFRSFWQGKPIRWSLSADPFLYPQAVDGWYYMVLNSRDLDAPVNQAGCVTTLRSRDLKTWEAGPILAYPGWCERPETPCVWRHGDRWYLSIGVAHDQSELPASWTALVPAELRQTRRVNAVFTSDRFDGPYRPMAGQWWITLPDGRWGYIHKVLPDPAGRDVLITTTQDCISRPYPVVYAPDGSITLLTPEP